MTQQLKIYNSKEIKHVRELLTQQYGYTGKLDVVFMLSEKKQRLYIFTKDLASVNIEKLRIDSMGLYFGTFYEDMLRLTIEGTQLLGKECTNNIIEVNKTEMQQWMQGEKLLLNELEQKPQKIPEGFVILRHGNDYLGCGKMGGDTILNYVPKTRYIHALYDEVADGKKAEE